MTENSNAPDQEDNIVSGYYENYAETQKEILAIEIRKTRNHLFIIASIFLVSSFISLAMLNAVYLETVVWILIIPVLLTALGFLAIKEPLSAMIIAAIVVIGIWTYSIIVAGGLAVVSGWLVKAIIIYFLIAGFQHAREATRIKKELRV